MLYFIAYDSGWMDKDLFDIEDDVILTELIQNANRIKETKKKETENLINTLIGEMKSLYPSVYFSFEYDEAEDVYFIKHNQITNNAAFDEQFALRMSQYLWQKNIFNVGLCCNYSEKPKSSY